MNRTLIIPGSRFPVPGSRFFWVLVLAACASKGGKTPRRDGGDAAITVPVAAIDAGPATPAGTVAPYLLAPLADAADVTVRVEWKDATAKQRTSQGRDPCGHARPEYARVHTLHGVADAVVWLDVANGKAPPALAPATVTLRDCALSPAVQVAGRADASLIVRGIDERRAAVSVAWAETLTVTQAETVVARAELVVVGDAVELAMKPWLAAITTDASSDPAYVVVPPHPYVAVTDETGAAVLGEVPPGTYPVHAWLRAGDGEAPRVVDGEVVVEPGVDAAVTLSLGAP
jgi:hypothetical protein